MRKLVGAVFLMSAGLWGGIAARDALSRDVKRCAELCRLLEILAFEIERFRAPLPEFFAARTSDFEGEAGAICAEMSAALEKSEAFSNAWEHALRFIRPREREILAPLGSVLGSYGAAEEADAVRSAQMRLSRLRGEYEEALKDRGRVRVGLCSAAGAMLAVLLL